MGVESIVPNYFGHPRPFLFFSTFTHRQGRNLSVPPCHNAPMHSSSPELPYHPHLVVDLTGMQVTDNSSSSRGNPMLPRLSVMPMTAPQQRTPATPLAIGGPHSSSPRYGATITGFQVSGKPILCHTKNLRDWGMGDSVMVLYREQI